MLPFGQSSCESLVEPTNYHWRVKLTNHVEEKDRPVTGKHTARSLPLVYRHDSSSTHALDILCLPIHHSLKNFRSRLCNRLPPYTISSVRIPFVPGALRRLRLVKCSLNSSLVNSGSFLFLLVLWSVFLSAQDPYSSWSISACFPVLLVIRIISNRSFFYRREHWTIAWHGTWMPNENILQH